MTDVPIADIHVHATFYGFNRMRNDRALEDNPAAFHPWHELDSDVDAMEDGGRGLSYCQANFAKLIEGNVKLIFASFTPIEKGFFIGSAHGDSKPFGKELMRWARGSVPTSAIRSLMGADVDAAAGEALGILRNRGPIRRLLHHLMMGYSFERVQFLGTSAYDYWRELHLEYDFLKSCDGERHSVEIEMPDGPRQVEGAYRIVKDGEELDGVADSEDEVAVVLTIEGGHVFSVDTDLEPHSLSTMIERIGELKKWEHPILFLTLAHHFDNGICGHAHSLLDAADWIMDQSGRLNEDLDAARGLPVIRELLDLDEDLQDRGGRRILVDVRHMSARSRRTYYREVVEPYNSWRQEQSEEYQRRYPQIPVVMSHGAYANMSTLGEMIEYEDQEGDHFRRGGFYSWNINLSDEDIEMVRATGGLVGLCFDRRILGVGPGEKVPDVLWPDVVIKQILAMADVAMVDNGLDDEAKKKIWDCICLGTDYDGAIQPVESYCTAADLPRFVDDLRRRLERIGHTRFIDAIGVDEVVEKIVWKNAYDFARRHLPAAAGR